jgi:hypothetical protein
LENQITNSIALGAVHKLPAAVNLQKKIPSTAVALLITDE